MKNGPHFLNSVLLARYWSDFCMRYKNMRVFINIESFCWIFIKKMFSSSVTEVSSDMMFSLLSSRVILFATFSSQKKEVGCFPKNFVICDFFDN